MMPLVYLHFNYFATGYKDVKPSSAAPVVKSPNDLIDQRLIAHWSWNFILSFLSLSLSHDVVIV